MTDMGVLLVFNKLTCKILCGDKILATRVCFGTLFCLDASIILVCNSLEVCDFGNCKLPTKKTMLWHECIGHIGEKGLMALKFNCIVERLVDCSLDFDFCEQNPITFYSISTRFEGIGFDS